jgi:hypothetical protein
MQFNGYKTCFFELKYFLNCSTVQHSTTEEVISYQSQSQLAVLHLVTLSSPGE